MLLLLLLLLLLVLLPLLPLLSGASEYMGSLAHLLLGWVTSCDSCAAPAVSTALAALKNPRAPCPAPASAPEPTLVLVKERAAPTKSLLMPAPAGVGDA